MWHQHFSPKYVISSPTSHPPRYLEAVLGLNRGWDYISLHPHIVLVVFPLYPDSRSIGRMEVLYHFGIYIYTIDHRYRYIPSGTLKQRTGKSSFFIDKSTISMGHGFQFANCQFTGSGSISINHHIFPIFFQQITICSIYFPQITIFFHIFHHKSPLCHPMPRVTQKSPGRPGQVLPRTARPGLKMVWKLGDPRGAAVQKRCIECVENSTVSVYYLSGWWFQTFGLFSSSYMGCHPSH